MTRYTHIHASQRFDRPAALSVAAVRRYVTEASVITLTETDGGRWQALHRATAPLAHRAAFASGELLEAWDPKRGLPNWNVANRRECAVMWNGDLWMLLDVVTVFWDGEYTTNGHTWREWAAPIVVLEHRKTRDRLIVASVHAPAGVEEYGRWTTNKARRDAWRAQVESVRARCNELALANTTDAVGLTRSVGMVIGGDFNVSLRSQFARRWFTANMPRWRHGWEKTRPWRGTHAGRRVIDLVLVKRARHVKRPVVLAGKHVKASSDHNAVKAVIEL